MNPISPKYSPSLSDRMRRPETHGEDSSFPGKIQDGFQFSTDTPPQKISLLARIEKNIEERPLSVLLGTLGLAAAITVATVCLWGTPGIGPSAQSLIDPANPASLLSPSNPANPIGLLH